MVWKPMNFLDALAPEGTDRTLALAIDPERIPAHIAIIMDGNGRWADGRGLPRFAGHRPASPPVRSVVEDCAAYRRPGADALRVFRRKLEAPARRGRYALAACCAFICAVRSKICSVTISGCNRAVAWKPCRRARMKFCSPPSAPRPEPACASTSPSITARGTSSSTLLTRSRRSAHRRPPFESGVDEDTISRRLYTAGLPDPDLLIRTSGEMRISNFLLWQIAYAELYVTEHALAGFQPCRTAEGDPARFPAPRTPLRRSHRRTSPPTCRAEQIDEQEMDEIRLSTARRNEARRHRTASRSRCCLFGLFALHGICSSRWSRFSLSLCFIEYARITAASAPPGYVAGLLILIAPQNETALILFLTTLAAICLALVARISRRARLSRLRW